MTMLMLRVLAAASIPKMLPALKALPDILLPTFKQSVLSAFSGPAFAPSFHAFATLGAAYVHRRNDLLNAEAATEHRQFAKARVFAVRDAETRCAA